MAIRTFVDSCVLIAAATGQRDVCEVAMQVLEDPDRLILSSDFVRLEVLPKAIYNRRPKEVRFYEEFFAGVEGWAQPTPAMVRDAHDAACTFGLQAMDALHVVSAQALGADELVTLEKGTTPLHRVTTVRVRGIGPPGQAAGP